jgi:hypothetical protein
MFVVFDVQNRESGPYLMTINRILMAVKAKVADFGLARRMTASERAAEEERRRLEMEAAANGTAPAPAEADLLGTYGYVAPEFARTGGTRP